LLVEIRFDFVLKFFRCPLAIVLRRGTSKTQRPSRKDTGCCLIFDLSRRRTCKRPRRQSWSEQIRAGKLTNAINFQRRRIRIPPFGSAGAGGVRGAEFGVDTAREIGGTGVGRGSVAPATRTSSMTSLSEISSIFPTSHARICCPRPSDHDFRLGCVATQRAAAVAGSTVAQKDAPAASGLFRISNKSSASGEIRDRIELH